MLKIIICCAVLSLSASCSHKKPDGPGKRFNISKVPDAIPKDEKPRKRGNPDSYVVFGKRYFVMRSGKDYVEKGIASWYGSKFHGRDTSSGEVYDMYQMTAAHKTLPLPTYVKVTNLANNRSVVLRVNDRGPFHGDRIIDLSYAAALKLDMVRTGTARVEVRALDSGKQSTISSTVAASEPDWRDESHLDGRLFVQVGAFRSATGADTLRSALLKKQFKYIYITSAEDDQGVLHRVRIGPLSSIAETQATMRQLNIQGYQAQIIVEE